MNKKVNFKIVLGLIILIPIGIAFYFWYNSGSKQPGYLSADDIPTKPKKYEVNEYSNLYISDQDMCTKYLNDFLSIVNHDVKSAYYLLDENYRNEKFGTIENFVLYIDNNYNTFSEISRYYVLDDIYYVYDNSGNTFVFSTKGVMTYKVYLDEETVKITKYK